MVYSHYVHVKYIKKGGPTRNYTQTVGTQKSEVIIRNNNNRNNVIGNSILNNGQKKKHFLICKCTKSGNHYISIPHYSRLLLKADT